MRIPHSSFRPSHLTSPPLRFSSSSSLSSRPPSFLRRNRTPLLLSTLSLALGLSAGTFISHTLAPPALPLPDTHEDAILLADLTTRIDSAFKVQVLRGKCLGVRQQLRGSEATGWVELELPTPLSSSENPTEATPQRRGALLAHLRGARGTGVERVFWDRDSGKVVAVVWFGGGVAGWPGVTHGGMLATGLVEKLGLGEVLGRRKAEVAGSGGEEGVMVPGTGQHARIRVAEGVLAQAREPEELALTYRRPTYANEFYVIRVTPTWKTEGEEEEGEEEGKRGVGRRGGRDWEASLETMDGKVCVLAKATFGASGSLVERVEQKTVETAKRSYADFREWMWPSRQRDSRLG